MPYSSICMNVNCGHPRYEHDQNKGRCRSGRHGAVSECNCVSFNASVEPIQEAVITVARSIEHAKLLRECGNDPIIVKDNDGRVCVYTASNVILEKCILISILDDKTLRFHNDEYGWVCIFTSARLGQVVEFLITD